MSASMGRVLRALAIGVLLAISMSVSAETSVQLAQFTPAPENKPAPQKGPAPQNKPAPQKGPALQNKPTLQNKPASRTATAVPAGGVGAAAAANKWTIGLASGLPEGTFIRFGGEIARNLNDGDKLRVIPMMTYGATDNV